MTDLRRLLESGVIGRLTMQDPMLRADQLRSLTYVLGETTKVAERELRRLTGEDDHS